MSTLAVVPIFMGAGAAVLPTVLAALASIAAIALKPRELVRLALKRPATTGFTILTIAILAWGGWRMVNAKSAAQSARGSDTRNAHPDWAKVAQDLIARESAGLAPTVPSDASVPAQPVSLAAASSFSTGPSIPTVGQSPHLISPATSASIRIVPDFSRCLFDGGAAPLKLKPLWRFAPDETMFLSRPAIAGNRVYVAGCQSDLGGYTGILACIELDSGKPLWRITELGADVLKPFFSSPALSEDGKYLVIGQGLHEDRDCALLCFDTQTHQLRWSVKTPLHIESSPAIFGDMAVAGAGAIESKDGRPTGDPGFVLAVRISDGKELWRQPVNDPECSPAIDETGRVYIGSGVNGDAVVALRSEADDVLKEKQLDRIAWRTPVGVPVMGAVTLVPGLVIAGAGNGDFVHSSANARGLIVALDRQTGSIRWQTPTPDSVLGTIAARGGMLICPCRSGEILALAQENGEILWRSRVSGKAPILAGTAFTGERVYAVSSDGYLAILDAQKGAILEKLALNDSARPGNGLSGCAPQVVGGRIIVGSETGGVQCLVGTVTAATGSGGMP